MEIACWGKICYEEICGKRKLRDHVERMEAES